MRRALGILAAALVAAALVFVVSGLAPAGVPAAAGQEPGGGPPGPTAPRGTGDDTGASGGDRGADRGDDDDGDGREGLNPLGLAAFVVAGILVVVFGVWWRPSVVPGMPGTWGRAPRGSSSRGRRR